MARPDIAEPTITCPNCKSEIKLTESLAAPILETARLEFQERLAAKDEEIQEREDALKSREQELTKVKEDLKEEMAEKLKEEREKIAVEEAKRARLLLKDDLDQQSKQIEDLESVLKQRDEKLAEAQKVQADLLKKQRELDDAKRELDLTVEKGIQEGLEESREKAKKEAEEALGLKVKEREKTISDLQKQIEEMKRKAEQGSQQMQGEVQELQLESLLSERFPQDTINPVPKGEFGGDVLQTVFGPLNQPCGIIIWESKRTKNWSDKWLQKVRDDQRAAKADIAVIVSQALPKDVHVFDLIDGVWVVQSSSAIPVAVCLRELLIDVATARQTSEGIQTKTEMVYQYLTGSRFRQRVEAIVEAFSTMQDDLAKEKKSIMRQWAKRESQIERVIGATAGMYGDLQGIAGASLQEIEGLAFTSDDNQAQLEDSS